MDEAKTQQVQETINSPEGTKVLTALIHMFVDVKDETFAIFDDQFDSAAESEAAKQGWQTLASGIGMIAVLNAIQLATSGAVKSAE